MIIWGDGFNQANLNQELYQKWLEKVCLSEGKALGDLGVELIDDERLLEINQSFLNHDYYTDIITFDQSYNKCVTGELWISLDRVSENAKVRGLPVSEELSRVIVHGVLHLIGHSDSSVSEKEKMTALENVYLNLLKEMFHVEQERHGKNI